MWISQLSNYLWLSFKSIPKRSLECVVSWLSKRCLSYSIKKMGWRSSWVDYMLTVYQFVSFVWSRHCKSVNKKRNIWRNHKHIRRRRRRRRQRIRWKRTRGSRCRSRRREKKMLEKLIQLRIIMKHEKMWAI